MPKPLPISIASFVIKMLADAAKSSFYTIFAHYLNGTEKNRAKIRKTDLIVN